MSDTTKTIKEIWAEEVSRLTGLATSLCVGDRADLKRALESVEDRLPRLEYLRKADLYRTMYVLMLIRMGNQIWKLDHRIETLEREMKELREKIISN